MQKYFTKWGHHLYPLDGEQHPNEVGYYLVSDVDVRIEQLERALQSCKAALQQHLKHQTVFEKMASDAYDEAEKALSLSGEDHS